MNLICIYLIGSKFLLVDSVDFFEIHLLFLIFIHYLNSQNACLYYYPLW